MMEVLLLGEKVDGPLLIVCEVLIIQSSKVTVLNLKMCRKSGNGRSYFEHWSYGVT